MADIKLKLIADQLGKSLENLAPWVEQELASAIENVSQAAHSAMIAKLQSMSVNPKNRQDYLRALNYRKIDNNNYLIFLDGDWPNKLESGFSPYSIKDQLLKSTKVVGVGSRAGKPWVRTSSQGKKYAAVPFEHKPFSKDKGQGGDLAESIKQIMIPNMKGKAQKITSVMKDLEGNALRGKVAVVDEHSNPLLSGLTKYQFVHETGKVSSIYMTFRMVHEDSTGWQHPGHKGYHIFKEAEEFIESELENIINTLL